MEQTPPNPSFPSHALSNTDALHSRLDASLSIKKPTRRVPPSKTPHPPNHLDPITNHERKQRRASRSFTRDEFRGNTGAHGAVRLDEDALEEHTRRNPGKSPFSAVRASLSTIETKQRHRSSAANTTPHPLAHHQLHQPSRNARSRTQIDTASHQRLPPPSDHLQRAEKSAQHDSLIENVVDSLIDAPAQTSPDKAPGGSIGKGQGRRRSAVDRSSQSTAPRSDGTIESAAKGVVEAIICDVVEDVMHNKELDAQDQKGCDVYAVPVREEKPDTGMAVGRAVEPEEVAKGRQEIEPKE